MIIYLNLALVDSITIVWNTKGIEIQIYEDKFKYLFFL
jgi:hypothetical protein